MNKIDPIEENDMLKRLAADACEVLALGAFMTFVAALARSWPG